MASGAKSAGRPSAGTLHLTPEEEAAIDTIPYDGLPLPDWRELRDVTVLRSGICMRHWRILPDSVHQYPHLRARFAKIAYGSRLSRRLTRLPDTGRYVVAHNLWAGGYYHWITEALPRIMALDPWPADAILLLPRNVGIRCAMAESARLLGVAVVETFPPGRNVRAPRLILPRNPDRQLEIAPATLAALRARLLDAAGLRADVAPHRRIYVSRARARARRITNEDEIAAHLARHGFERVFMEDLDLRAQMALMLEAEAVVGLHGAGLTNIAFMQPGARVLEIFRHAPGRANWAPVRRTTRLHPAFARLAWAGGQHYFALLAEAADAGQSFDEGDVTVDTRALEAKLAAMERV